MLLRPPRPTPTYTPFPYTTPFRSPDELPFALPSSAMFAVLCWFQTELGEFHQGEPDEAATLGECRVVGTVGPVGEIVGAGERLDDVAERPALLILRGIAAGERLDGADVRRLGGRRQQTGRASWRERECQDV